MSAHYASWRFTFHAPGAPGAGGGLAASSAGRIELANDADAVRQDILMLVSTKPGERVMRPQYGCHLSRLVFAVNDDTTAGLAIHYVRQALQRWEPRIEILRLDANANPQHPSRLQIHLQYRLRVHQRVDELRFSLDLGTAR